VIESLLGLPVIMSVECPIVYDYKLLLTSYGGMWKAARRIQWESQLLISKEVTTARWTWSTWPMASLVSSSGGNS